MKAEMFTQEHYFDTVTCDRSFTKRGAIKNLGMLFLLEMYNSRALLIRDTI